MEDKASVFIVARTLSLVLFLLALGMLCAKMFAGIEISTAIITSQLVIGTALLVITQSGNKKSD